MQKILLQGERREDRTGFGTLSLFGESLRFDLTEAFPATTCKRLAFKQVCAELAAFLRGYSNLAEFHELGCKVWDANATHPRWLGNPNRQGEGDMGRIYGVQWRRWRNQSGGGLTARTDYIDQLHDAIEILRHDPWSRRAVVTAWNPGELDDVCLPPCHTMFQFSVRHDRNMRPSLDCAVTMRSVDTFLGMPFDIASYALLTHLAAWELNMPAGNLIMWFGDTHIYTNHLDQCREVLERDLRDGPMLVLTPGENYPAKPLDEFHPSWASLENYDPHPSVQADMNP